MYAIYVCIMLRMHVLQVLIFTLIINRWGRDEWSEYLKDFDVLGMTPEVFTPCLCECVCMQISVFVNTISGCSSVYTMYVCMVCK